MIYGFYIVAAVAVDVSGGYLLGLSTVPSHE